MNQDAFFVHPLALVDSDQVGPRTRIWAWAHVMEGARVGADCNIGEQCFIERGAVIGDRVTVKNGVSVWDGVTVEDDVFLGPHAVLTNDIRPRSRAEGFTPTPTILRRGCSIGANATVVAGVAVGRHAMIGAGTVVTRDVPDYGMVVGNPGRLRTYVSVCGEELRFDERAARCVCGRRYEIDDTGVTELL